MSDTLSGVLPSPEAKASHIQASIALVRVALMMGGHYSRRDTHTLRSEQQGLLRRKLTRPVASPFREVPLREVFASSLFLDVLNAFLHSFPSFSGKS